jgi:hypothetical protein
MTDNQAENDTNSEVETQEPIKTRRGRPRATVDLEQVYKLASVGCTIKEVSWIMDVHEDTVQRREDIRDAYDRGTENARVRLRKAMFINAIERYNPALQIWLSKQILGMSDHGYNTADNNAALPWSDD